MTDKGWRRVLGNKSLPVHRGGRGNKKFNAQTQIAQPKFLIGKT